MLSKLSSRKARRRQSVHMRKVAAESANTGLDGRTYEIFDVTQRIRALPIITGGTTTFADHIAGCEDACLEDESEGIHFHSTECSSMLASDSLPFAHFFGVGVSKSRRHPTLESSFNYQKINKSLSTPRGRNPGDIEETISRCVPLCQWI